MRPSRRQLYKRILNGGGVFAAALALTIIMWRTGALESLDLKFYDAYVRHSFLAKSAPSPVVILGITEEDITSRNYGGWPINDAKLADLIEWLVSRGPAVIGVDLWRDLPVPVSGVELPRLERVLLQYTNVVVVDKFGDPLRDGIRSPPVLRSKPSQLGFSDFPIDNDNVVRRGFLYLGGQESSSESLAWRLAQNFLMREGIMPTQSQQNANDVHLGGAIIPRLRTDDGPYVKMDASGYQVLLDFQSKLKSFSLNDVFGGRVPSNALKGKVVILGARARSTKDTLSTPLRYDQPGVEIQACFVDQLIRNAHGVSPVMRYTPEWFEWTLLLGFGLLGIIVGLWLPSPWMSPFVLLGAALVLAIISWFLLSASRWIPIVPLFSSFVLTLASAVLFKSYFEKQKRALLLNLLSIHVSREIAGEIWKHRDEFMDGERPKAQDLVATVLFTDMCDFSTVSEKMQPTELMPWLNNYIEQICNEIYSHNGIVNEYTGDGIMATFGIPIPRTTVEQITGDAKNAVEAALGMANALNALNKSFATTSEPIIKMRVGIFTGPLVSGSVGNTKHMKYALVGDTVNTASRLESSKKELNDSRSPIPACRILVGESTWNLVQDFFVGKPQGIFELKGKVNRVSVTQVFCKKL